VKTTFNPWISSISWSFCGTKEVTVEEKQAADKKEKPTIKIPELL
jgi:hypothetical protein